MCNGSQLCGCNFHSLQGIGSNNYYGNSITNQQSPYNTQIHPSHNHKQLTAEELIKIFNENIQYKPQNQIPKGLVKMAKRITSKTYVAVSATTGNVVSVDEDLSVVKKDAASVAHKEEGAVIVFKPVFQVEPKRDVVETEITL